MQSLAVYGRLVVRAVLSELTGEFPNALPWHGGLSTFQPLRRSFHLVTAASGLSKSHSTLLSAQNLLKPRSFGDDACFVARHKLGDVLGVADGVGGWRTYGVDPSLFPKSLMAACERMVNSGHFTPRDPVDVLSSGYYEVQQEKAPLIGSCTACVVALHREESTIYTANLGDSGFRVIRAGKIVHRSQEQQHYFNTPFQLAVAPSDMQGLVLSDSPDSAETSSFVVQEGDIIILGTDGLFDNMKDEMILKHIARLKDHWSDIQEVADSIVTEAHKLGFDPHYVSPFSLNAAANGFDVVGGKPDDVTVLIGRVTVGDLQT
jgi:protein phosphatase PTC7